MACSTNFPTPRNDAPSSDSHKEREEGARPKEQDRNVHQPSSNLARQLVAPLASSSRRRMSEHSCSTGAGAAPSQPAPSSPTIAILLIVFDSQNSPGRNGVLHLLSSLPAHSLPLQPPAVTLVPRAFLARPGERPHQLEQFSTPRYANYMLSTARIASLQRASESTWTPLGPLAGLLDGTAYTTATVPTLDLEDPHTKAFLENLAGNMPNGRLPFDPRRAHVLYLAPIERRYPSQQQSTSSGRGSSVLPSVRQLLSTHQPSPAQAGPSYANQYPPQGQSSRPAPYPTPPGTYGGMQEIKREEPEQNPFYRQATSAAYLHPEYRPSTSAGQGRLRFPPPSDSPYALSQAESPEENRSSDTTSPSPQSMSLSPQMSYPPIKRATSRVSPSASTAGPSRGYSRRTASDDAAFPYIASYLSSRFPDIAIALERRGDTAPSLNGPWWFQIHTSAFMHVCNALDMPTMRETQSYTVPPSALPGPPSPNAPWDGRITADDVARWFASFPKSNSVARSTIRNHVGVLRRWQTLWERAEMQYYRDRAILARPLPASGPERDAYLATELLGVLGFVFARNAEERRNLLAPGMHPQALERAANRWPWGEVEEKIVRFFPEFGPKRRPRDPAGGGAPGGSGGA